jgi:predicted esterase
MRMRAGLLLLSLSVVTAAAETRTGDLVLQTTLPQLLGEQTAARIEPVIPADEIVQWVTFVPSGYDPSKPPGLLVYISPTQSGRLPRGWKEVLEAHNLVWIAANRSGNAELVTRRVLLATLAVEVAGRHYEIDKMRIYISGLSGGGKTASMVATDYPNLFRGAIYNCGVEVWDVDMPRYIEQMRRNRFVFVTGTYDQALEPTERAYRAYLDAGIEHSKLMVIRNMTHQNPGRYDFEEALAFLDGDPQAAEDTD